MMDKQQIYEQLTRRGIPFEVTEHEAVYTIDQMQEIGICSQGLVCKNLFLRDQKGKRHFLVVIPGEKQADLKQLALQLDSGKLSFASAERLERYLGLHQGEVTPLGIFNDEARAVEVAFDRELEGQPRLGVHPNDNTATVWIAFSDLKALIEEHGNPFSLITL